MAVLFLAPEPLHASLTGPARRAVKLAAVLGEHCAVTLAAPAPSVFPDGPFRTLETGPAHAQDLGAAVRGHEIAVVQTLPSPRQLISVRSNVPRLVVDVIAPLALEVAETGEDTRAQRSLVRWRARDMLAHLAAADLVLCSNEKQRDFLIGAGVAAGLLEPTSTRPLHERIAVVPHGLDPEPSRGRPVLRSDGFASASDRIAVWGGGIWSWLDPLTAIKAIARLRPSRPDLKLAFVGLEHPDPCHRRAHEPRAAEALSYVRERDLGDAVTFRPRWLSRDDYVEHLHDADVGVSLNGPTLEGRYASRTRVLDYLNAGLPVVCTRGDTMSEFVESQRVGRAVQPLDVAGCADALNLLTTPDAPRIDTRAALEPFLWPNVARPLVAYCLDPRAGANRSWRASMLVAARGYPAFLRAVYRTEGIPGLVRAGLRRGAVLLGRRV